MFLTNKEGNLNIVLLSNYAFKSKFLKVSLFLKYILWFYITGRSTYLT